MDEEKIKEEIKNLAETLKASGLATEQDALEKAKQMLEKKNKGKLIKVDNKKSD